MPNAKAGSILLYVGYFLISYSVTVGFLIFLNILGLRNFAFIEACFIGASFSSYLFFNNHKRAMFFPEQSKITWLSVMVLLLLSMISFEALLHLGGNLEQKITLLAKSLGILMVFYGLWLSFTIIFTLSFFKLSATVIHNHQANPDKLLSVFLRLSLIIFIADISINFLIHFLK